MYKSHSFKTKAHALVIAATIGTFSQQINAAEPSHLEHPHGAGTFMVEAMYMRMNMDGLRAGTSDVSTSEAIAAPGTYQHAQVPSTMTMDMYMLMPMYNFTKDLSAMLMFNYLNNNMDMKGVNGCDTSMSTSGVADTQASLSYKFLDDQFAVSMEVNLPTGSIDEKTKMDMYMEMGGSSMCMSGHTMKAPYGMQLGSGTFDYTPSLTYLGAYYSWRYGAQVSYKYRSGENINDYTLGNEAKAKLWVRKPVFGVTLSGELDVKRWGSIKGADSEMWTNTAAGTGFGGTPVTYKASPTNFTSNYGGTLAEVSLGVNVPVSMFYVLGELAFPVYQDLNGLQMKRTTSWTLALGTMF